MNAFSDRIGSFPELISGRYRIYSNKERYEYNNSKFLYFVWDCYGDVKALCSKAILLRPNPVLVVF